MDGSIVYLYAALGITLLAILGYILFLNGRLQALRRERDALDQSGAWSRNESDDAEPR